VSRLRARCPDCRTLTAVALGPDYECHACGRSFAAGLVRVPRAWGEGGERMAEAARLPLPWPETSVIEAGTLAEQSLELAAELPERPLVLGGCCCAHVGAVEGLAARYDRLAVLWLDAHGDLNTPATSPSGNTWGMPLRMLLDAGTVRPEDVALLGARSLDPPEEAFLAGSEVHRAAGPALAGADAVYIALDWDVFDPAEGVVCFMPEPAGATLAEVETLLSALPLPLAGAGFSGLADDPRNVEPLARLARSLGF
jgi:arginase